MRIVFLGSPEVVVSALKKLQQDCPGHQLVGVVSQPAKPFGRGGQVRNPAVAEYAMSVGLPLLQPESAKDPDFQNQLKELEPDVCVTAAYGQILNDAFLGIPKRATINIHPSLLPQYRGASPVQSALYEGDTVTGVTILFTVRALDAGAIICQKEFTIDPEETAVNLMPRLFQEGANLLPEALEKLSNPEFSGTPQDASAVTHCRKFSKEDGKVDWTRSAVFVRNCYRAFQPWPGIFTFLGDKRIALTAVETTDGDTNLSPGQFEFHKPTKVLLCGTGAGALAIRKLKPAGSKEQDAAAFWNGVQGKVSQYQFGSPEQ